MNGKMTAQALESSGFHGFTRFQDLRDGALSTVPQTEGAYVVLRRSAAPPAFLTESCGGHFKGKNPTVSTAVLEANWVDDAQVVYVGRTNNLQRRLREFAAYGAGKPVGHQGGRYIWQLEDSDDLLVAWKRCSENQTAGSLEAELVTVFKAEHRRLPFANIADPSAGS
jgi:hypothetical protein